MAEWVRTVGHRVLYPVLGRWRRRVTVMPALESAREVATGRWSVVRFGDGEFALMMSWLSRRRHPVSLGFQDYDPALAERLCQVLARAQNAQADSRLRIALPAPMFTAKAPGLSAQATNWWRRQSTSIIAKSLVRPGILRLLAPQYGYLDACFTRFYINYADKELPAQIFAEVRNIWQGRRVLVVEGEQTHMGDGNDLFDNAQSVRRIVCPARNAFSSYHDILTRTVATASPDDLILIALGPTATVLAADLADRGLQAIDIGHVDIEYEWMRRAATTKIPIPGKYTNEAYLPNHL